MLKQGIYENIINSQVEKEITKAEDLDLYVKSNQSTMPNLQNYWQITWQKLSARNLKTQKLNKTELISLTAF